jgi:cytochrome c553
MARWCEAISLATSCGRCHCANFSSHMSFEFFVRGVLRHGLCAALLGAACAQAADGVVHRVPDTMAQRVMACTLCHGKEGRATNSGFFPRIAGKPEGYLYHQLRHFREGRRNNAGMTALLDHLNDAYLHEIAQHFASLDLPYPPPLSSDAPEALLAQGAALVQRGDASRDVPACVACHGAAMTGVRPNVPGLLGLPRDYLIGQLGGWQTGLRKGFAPDCMAHVAQKLAPADISAVAAWLAAQPLPADPHPVAAMGEPMPLRCGVAPEVKP